MVYFIFILRPWMRTTKKLEKLSISWVVAGKLPNHIEIAELPEIIFFFNRKNLFFLLTSNLCLIKTRYSLDKILMSLF